jgi:hypothetical protein
MRRAELRDELERLGSRPVPLPDPRRVDAIEHRLYEEFVVTPASSGAALLAARRRRRLVLVGGLGAAAAASVAAVVLHRGSTPGFELQAASGEIGRHHDLEAAALQVLHGALALGLALALVQRRDRVFAPFELAREAIGALALPREHDGAAHLARARQQAVEQLDLQVVGYRVDVKH